LPRGDIVLGGGEPIPFQRLGIVLRDASGVIVADGEIVLCVGVALLGRAPIPFQGLGKVLRHAFAMGVHDAEISFRSRIALFRQRSKQRQRGCIILALVGGESVIEGGGECGIGQHQRQREQIPAPPTFHFGKLSQRPGKRPLK
jgi:hypothetical protein